MNLNKLITGTLVFAITAIAHLPSHAADLEGEGLQTSLPRPDPAVAEFARGVKFIVNGYTGTEVLTNFPVLVRLSESTIDGFHYSDFTRADYKDLCFVDMQTNGLPCEVDTWNASGESLVWVTLPRVTNGTEFVMWYHSSSVGSLVCDANAWGDYAGVWHMNDSGDGAVTISDSTTNELHAAATASSYAQPDGRIGGARIPTKDGSSKNTDRIEVNLNTNTKKAVVKGVNTDADHAFTVSMWIKPMKYSSFDGPNSAYLMGRKTKDDDQYWGIQFHYVNDSVKSPYYNYFRVWRNEKDNNNNWKPQFADSVIPNAASSCYGNWYKLDIVYSKTNAYFYVNGGGAPNSCLTDINRTTAVPANPPDNSAKLFLTGSSVNSKVRPFRGDFDEFRLRAGAMSADWVKADFDTVDNSSFLSAGTVQTVKVKELPSASFSLFDSGAAFATFSGVISSLGEEEATSGNVYYKVWPSSGSEPTSPDDGWRLLRSGLAANVAFTESVTGLTPGTAYSWKLYAKNDLGDSTEEVAEGSFTTSGAGVAGIGGDTYRVHDDYVHRFTVDDDDTTSYEFTPPSYVTTLRALVVAGGGAGGYDRGGGGGAGGLVYNPALALSGGTTYTVNVGTGGVSTASVDVRGGNGGDSSIVGDGVNLVVVGGGAGGNYGNNNSIRSGVAGGSGGGATPSGSVGNATSGQGNKGGKGVARDNFINGGGGGGSSEPGGDAPDAGATHCAGGGGAGFSTDISGENVYYAGGGGGGADVPLKNNIANSPGLGGNGGGGDGGSQTVAATSGQDHLGGGGGGGYLNSAGGNGGSGVVILRYAVQGDGQGMTEPAIALESLSRDDQTGVTTVGYRVAWAGDGYDYADVAVVWDFSKHDLSHTNAIASSAIGRGSGTFTLPDQTKTVFVRALATNAVAGALSTEIIRIPFSNPSAPVVDLPVVSNIQGTGASFSADVTGLGVGASRVQGVFQVCTDDDFEGTVLSFPAGQTLTEAGSLTAKATGLSVRTTYYVRVSATNDVPAVFETDPVSFRTLAPGKPNGSVVTNLTNVANPPTECAPPVATATTITAWGYLYSPGNNGASYADLRLEASTNAAFKPVVAYSATEAGVPQRGYRSFTLTNLEPETDYYLRLRMENDGQISDYSKVVGPFATEAAAPTTVSLTFSAEMPANVSVSSVATNGVAVAAEGGAYVVESGAEVTVTFAAAEGYTLVGDASVTITVSGDSEFPTDFQGAAFPTAVSTPASLTFAATPANVSVASVTNNGVAVAAVNGVYTVERGSQVTVTFAAAGGYVLVGDASVTITVSGDSEFPTDFQGAAFPTAVEKTASLTFPAMPANVSVVSVTTNGAPVVADNGAYTVKAGAEVVVTFAAAEGYTLVGNASVTITVDDDTVFSSASIPATISTPTVTQSATKIYARQTVTLTASAAGATSYYWLKNGAQIEGGASGTLTVAWRSPKNQPTDTYQAVAVYDIDGLPVESEASAEMTVTNLPMGTVIIVRGGAPAPPPPHDYSADYLTFRVLTSGTISWKSFGDQAKTIEYSIDNGAWTSLTATSEGATISVVEGDLVRFRGSNTTYAKDKSNYSGFEGGTATYDIEGNIMSLLYGDSFAESTIFQGNSYIFCSLFKKAPVISAEHLVLPATTLKEYCYRALFSWCTTLTKAPELPATTLAKGCYWYMFEQCAITEAPVLNATTLVAECYGHMFEGCGLLNRITCLATSGFNASNCLAEWVKNVAGDGTFVKAADATSWTTGTSGIPSGWIVCEDVLLLPPEVSFFGDTIELECDTAGAEIHYRLGQTGSFALYTQPISIVADTVVEAYSAYQGHTSPTVTQTCVYVHETPFERSNKDLTTWRYGGGTITTPYSVNGIDGHSGSYSKGTFSFDTSITLREKQPTYLWFQHADQSADIYVDGVNVGTHWGGYNAFFFDISDYVHRGKNDIRVALCNNRGSSLAPAAGDFNFNATLGNVKLFTSPVLPAMEYGYDGFHITSTVSASSATTNATIYVETSVPVGANLKCIISDDSYAWTNTLASSGTKQTFTNTISNAHLWNGTLDPHLYTVTLEIYKDGDMYHRYERPYGFRYYSYVINETVNGQTYTGFLLNGQPYQLRGVCMHDDVEGKANALTESDYDQEFDIIDELGCNFIRLAHYPHPKEVYDRCDQRGIIVQTEVPCVNKLQTSMPDDYYTHLETQYTDMVQQHFNHPCIVFWGLSNETTTDDKAFGKEKIEGYYRLIKGLDPERLVGYVMSHGTDNPSGYYNHPEVDWFGCNIYVGWYIDKDSNDPSSQLNKRLKNTLTNRSKPLAFSEYGCGGTQHCHSEDIMTTTTRGNYARHDIEYQMWLHEGHIAAIRNYPQLLFTSQWQLFDIAVSSRNEGFTECLDGVNVSTNDVLRRLNNKGLVERDHRTKKDTFYLYKAEWNSKDKFVHICGKDYTKTTGRVLKCYTNDGDTLALYIGNEQTPRMTATVTDHIAEFEATDFPSGVEIRVKGATKSDTVTFQ